MIYYISTNNGSDMRINKEITTLLNNHFVIFYGIGTIQESLLPDSVNLELRMVSGNRRNIFTIARLVMLIYRDYFGKKERPNIHLINETLVFLLYPILLRSHSVLDLFDSFFLKKNKPNKKWLLLKMLVYFPFRKIIVTDTARAGLMPGYLKAKNVVVLGNYPNQSNLATGSRETAADKLVIMFFGWLGKNRGGDHIKGFLKDSRVSVIACGWFSDEETEIMVRTHNRIDYRGVMSQREALDVARKEADYIMCTYKPISMNNIYASPNKIFDAIQIETPIIINAEAIVSKFVRDNGIGWVMRDYDLDINSEIIDSLIVTKSTYSFSDEMKFLYTWEKNEYVLKEAHEI